ncbi:MAG: FecR family protein, partial [Bermanella sp.]
SNTIPAETAKQAVEWLMEWQSADDNNATWQSLCEWRQQHPQHEQAWQQIEAINSKFKQLNTVKQAEFAQTTLTSPTPAKLTISRRQALKALGVFCVVGSSSWLMAEQQPWQNWRADHHTRIGEQRRISLADGTQITLNSDSAISLHYSVSERRVKLLKGEIYIQTAKAEQPFIIQVSAGLLQPLGTRFSVRQFNNHCQVAVYQGRVQISPNQQRQSTVLESGLALSFSPHQWSDKTAVTGSHAAWTQGIMVANDMRLADFINELNRHRHGIIQCAPEVAELRISGSYPLNQADDVLQALTRAVPVKLQSFSRYWVRVVAATS